MLLIRLIGVCTDRDQPEFLCSRSDSRHLEVRVATAGGWLTRYRPREVRNSIYRYRNNIYRLSIEIFISIYIAYIDNLRQHYCEPLYPKCNRISSNKSMNMTPSSPLSDGSAILC